MINGANKNIAPRQIKISGRKFCLVLVSSPKIDPEFGVGVLVKIFSVGVLVIMVGSKITEAVASAEGVYLLRSIVGVAVGLMVGVVVGVFVGVGVLVAVGIGVLVGIGVGGTAAISSVTEGLVKPIPVFEIKAIFNLKL